MIAPSRLVMGEALLAGLYDGLRLERGGPAASDAVKENAWSYQIPFASALPRNRSAVVSMQQAWT